MLFRSIVSRIQSEIAKALTDPQLVARYTELGMAPGGGSPEQLTEIMRSTIDVTGKAVKQLGIQPQ